ncbi:hypothetical protein PV325_011698 [Microctonus aethiopoides]|uniref:Putative treble-clef zinc-finger domain-containing protein n=1 Tax=Microctonus aethiopoides TaxID=144406 RepID=A0AA39KKA5_9HYME|nr:hypothetical protein PV325_011698 [Microctonus aethiopoides]KAK0164487.1 hypothetical protein PV328_003111 [Microctonus aethiopoides]
MSNDERIRTLLSDLGKATLRGVKKCPKCGTYNGSRGSYCKNKFCDAVFKEVGEKRKLSTEACKLITGSTAQVYSVRVRDKGPDYRGFVQLPLINTTLSNDVTTVIPQTALCFVDSCERSFDTSVLKCHEKNLSDNIVEPTCQHIQASLKCYAEAQPLTLKNSILSSLNVNNETKREIWLLATETSGPLVQRVSKNIMAVKCKVSPKHPLGYLHLSFHTTKLKEKIEHGYSCSCSNYKSNPKTIGDKNNPACTLNIQKCAHFYACICAFASDPKLSEEFEFHIKLDGTELRRDDSYNSMDHPRQANKIIGIDLECLTDDSHLLIFRDDPLTVASLDGKRLDIDCINLDATILPRTTSQEIEIECEQALLRNNTVLTQVHDSDMLDSAEIINEQPIDILDGQSTAGIKYDLVDGVDFLLDDSSVKLVNNDVVHIFDDQICFNAKNFKLLNDCTSSDIDGMKQMNNNKNKNDNNGRNENDNNFGVLTQSNKFQISSGKRKRDEQLSLPNLGLNNFSSFENRKGKTKPSIIKKQDNICKNLDESNTNLSFIKWLASVTERINQTMHFQFDGKPEPLVFHAPQIFFDCLRERLSCGGKKKRLPNSTTAFIRKDGVPLGTFTKYTWQITNILHVKSIFETPLMPLEITQSFIQNADGTYKLYVRQQNEIDRYQKTGTSALIKPLELKTYLKVGNTSPDQIEPTPFLIEWIPDILPISKIGELRIRFEFGHINNNETNFQI